MVENSNNPGKVGAENVDEDFKQPEPIDIEKFESCELGSAITDSRFTEIPTI